MVKILLIFQFPFWSHLVCALPSQTGEICADVSCDTLDDSSLLQTKNRQHAIQQSEIGGGELGMGGNMVGNMGSKGGNRDRGGRGMAPGCQQRCRNLGENQCIKRCRAGETFLDEAPTPPPPPGGGGGAAADTCVVQCGSTGTSTVSCAQHPSCAMGCLVAEESASAEACKATCTAHDNTCDFWTAGGQQMDNCGECPGSGYPDSQSCLSGCDYFFESAPAPAPEPAPEPAPAPGGGPTSIQQTVSVHTLSAQVAVERGWTKRLSGVAFPTVPRHMQSASCTPAGASTERLFVAWDSHVSWEHSGDDHREVTQGNIAEFDINPDGTTTLVSDTAIQLCLEMGEVTALSDCSVVAMLCRSHIEPASVGAVDLLLKSSTPQVPHDMGWRNTWCHEDGSNCQSHDMRDDSMYLLEFTGTSGSASRTNHGASSKVRVNKAIGGWTYGNWGILLNQAADLYVLDLKVTAGSHEGSLNLAINRPQWTYNSQSSDAWSCGTGHTLMNQLTYNPELGVWARLCWTDWNDEAGEVCHTGQEPDCLEVKNMWAFYFQTLPDGQRQEIMQIPNQYAPGADDKNPWWHGPGGMASYISLGAHGWLGVGYRPLPADASKPFSEQQLTVTTVQFPTSSSDCGQQCSSSSFTDLPDLPVHSLWSYDGDTGSLGFVNGQLLRGAAESQSGADEVLIGYATGIQHEVHDWQAPEYRVAKITAAGQVLATEQLSGTGWGERDNWVRLSNGCVAFPFAWETAPGRRYGNEGNHGTQSTQGFSNKLRVTVVCDA